MNSEEKEVLEILELVDAVLVSNNEAAKTALRKFLMVATIVHSGQDASTLNGPITKMITDLSKRLAVTEAILSDLRANIKREQQAIEDDYYIKKYKDDYYNHINSNISKTIGEWYGTSFDELKKFK